MNEQELLNILFEVYRRDIKPENARNKILKALSERQSVSDNEKAKEILKYLTKISSTKVKGRFLFYVKYIQPIKEYFKID